MAAWRGLELFDGRSSLSSWLYRIATDRCLNLPDAETAIARPYGLMVLTLQGDQISAITWFGDSGLFPHFGLPGSLRAVFY